MSDVEEDPQPKVNESLEFLRKEQQFYHADLNHTEHSLHETSLTTIMVPVSGGVARQMDAVRTVDPSLRTVPTEMTRARRTYDWKNDRTADEGVTLETIEEAVKERSLLHFAITASGEVFGSRVTDLVGRHAIMHVGFDSFDQINDRALRQMHNVFLLMSGTTYAPRIGLDKLSPADAHMASQIEYGLQSIEFARTNIGNDIHTFMLVHNTQKSLAETAEAISRLTHQNSRESISNQQVLDNLAEMEIVLEEAKRRIGVQ